MNVGDTARIAHGPWAGFAGQVTALFPGYTAVRLAGMERTFANTELDDCGHPNHGGPDHDCKPFRSDAS